MADSRNDIMSSSRSIQSPTKRGNAYLINTSSTVDDASNLGISPSSNNSTPRKALMTESEISSMVHDALIRARKATKQFSPRTRSSPRSTDTLSPVSTKSNRVPAVSATTPSSVDKPPVHSSSPVSPLTNSQLPVNSASSCSSSKIMSVPTLSVASQDSTESQYGLPSHLRASLTSLSNRSSSAEDMHTDVGERGIMPNASISSVGSANSSDDIIRRVEAEIASARKAAQEATRRLAGVSKNFLADAKRSNPKIPKSLGIANSSSYEKETASKLDQQLGQMMRAETNGSSSTDEDRNFDSALDLIGEEFDDIVAGPSGDSIVLIEEKKEGDSIVIIEEKKEEDLGVGNHSERFSSRNRSIEECSLNYDPVDNLNALSTEGSMHNSSGIKSIVNINRSIDDFNIYELEAVLSDEREQDMMAKNANETNTQYSPIIQEMTGVVVKDFKDSQKEMDEQDAMASNEKDNDIENVPISQERTKSLEPENVLKNQETSFDQEREELDRQEGLKKLKDTKCVHEKTRDEMSLSPELSISVSISVSNDSVILEENSCRESIKDPDRETEDGCLDPSAQDIPVMVSPKTENFVITQDFSDIDIDDEANDDNKVGDERGTNNLVVAERNTENSFKDGGNLLTVNESNNDSKIQVRDDAIAISNENTMTIDRALSETTEVTKVTDSKISLPDRLLSDYLAKPTYPVTSGRRKSRSKRPSFSKTQHTIDPVGHTDTNSRHGPKVTFKKRYPIPQKMKKSREPSEILLDNQVEKRTNKLWLAMPKPDLKQLLDAVTGKSIQRRSNACGTLMVMSTQAKNQLTLVRIQGFMDAIVFAISDDYSIEDMEPGTAARTRAVNVVLNVSTKKDNRYHVLLHPNLRKSLVKCIIEDDGEARELACAVFATLAKSQHCRELIGKTENLVDALATILKRDVTPVIATDLEEAKTEYSGDDERSHLISNTFSSSASSSRSSVTRSSCGVDSIETHKKTLEMRKRTRMNACAALMHLSKECSISLELCESATLLFSLVLCCREFHNPIHTKCLEILANLTRFPQNNSRLVQFPGLVDALLLNGTQEDDFDRLWSMRIFQNLSSEPSAKTRLASSAVLELLSTGMMAKKYEEQLAATSAMYNISTEPGAVVPLTNTKNVVATLVHVAHSPTSMMEVRTIACDALSTLGLWLQTLSSSGTVPEGVNPVPLPSYITSGWQRWDE